jgi:eukaryotic-like serine/threonine-protein kinase
MSEPAGLSSELSAKLATHHLPVIRQTAAEIISLLSSPHSDIQTIARTILKNLAFTARVLAVANSAYYRRRTEKISTITQAILQVGFSTLRDIAIAAEFAEFSQKGSSTTLNLRRLLAKAFVAAQQASAIGREIKLQEAEALFTSTLLESLGEFALASAFPTIVREIDDLSCRESLCYEDAHFQVTGLTTHAVTAIAAAAYQLPEDLIVAPPDWKAVSEWTYEERRRAVVHLANDFAGNLFAAESPTIVQQFTTLLSKATAGLGLPLSALKSLIAEAFHKAMDLGVSVNLEETCFALDESPSEDTTRQNLVRSCARLPDGSAASSSKS